MNISWVACILTTMYVSVCSCVCITAASERSVQDYTEHVEFDLLMKRYHMYRYMYMYVLKPAIGSTSTSSAPATSELFVCSPEEQNNMGEVFEIHEYTCINTYVNTPSMMVHVGGG